MNNYEFYYYVFRGIYKTIMFTKCLREWFKRTFHIGSYYEFLLHNDFNEEEMIDLLSDFIIRSVKRKGHEVKVTEELLKRNGKVFIDVGSCFGYYVLLLHNNFKDVYAIEPHPFNIKVIKMVLNKQDIKNVTVIEKAMGRSEGTLPLYLSKSTSGHSLNKGIEKYEKDFIVVKIGTLDAFWRNVEMEIDLIKVDVEGFEWDVIKGSKNIMSRINCWMIEQHVWDLGDEEILKRQLESFMIGYDYSVRWLDSKHVLYARQPVSKMHF